VDVSRNANLPKMLKQSFIAALLAAILFFHFIFLHTKDAAQGLTIATDLYPACDP
jgi:hypothetical protein